MRNASIKLAVLVLMVLALSGCSGLTTVDTKIGEVFSYLETDEACQSDNGVCEPEMEKVESVDSGSGSEINKLSNKDKLMIDKWLTDQGYNRYGDPKDAIYLGGTPLFDEQTGESIDRFDYILERHPDILNNF